MCREVLQLLCTQPLWLPALKGPSVSGRLITPGDSQVGVLQRASAGLSHFGDTGLCGSPEPLISAGAARGVRPPALWSSLGHSVIVGCPLVRGHQVICHVVICVSGNPALRAGVQAEGWDPVYSGSQCGAQTPVECMHAQSLQSCLILCDPVDCSPPGSSVHGVLQARILEWVAGLSSRASSRPRD